MQIQEKLQVQMFGSRSRMVPRLAKCTLLIIQANLETAEALSMFQQLIMNQLLLVFIKVAVHTTKLILYKLNILMKLLIFHVIEICN